MIEPKRELYQHIGTKKSLLYKLILFVPIPIEKEIRTNFFY